MSEDVGKYTLGILINVETHQTGDSTGKTKCHFNLQFNAQIARDTFLKEEQ